MDIREGLNAILPPVARSVLGLGADLLARLGPADLTILFTDIEDYTPVADSQGDAAAQDLVRAHNALVRHALGEFGGHEIKHTGDGIMAWFLSSSRALMAAVRIQREVDAYNTRSATSEGGHSCELRVRMGLNAGEPILEDGDLYGTPVIVAARVADRARGQQILVTNVVRQLAAGKGFVFRRFATERLEGLSEAVDLFEVEWREPERPAEQPASATDPRP